MTTKNWIIERALNTESVDRMVSSIKRAGGQVYSPDFIPFNGLELEDNIEAKVPDWCWMDDTIFHGSIQACNWLQGKAANIQVFKNSREFNCSYYYTVLAGLCLNEDCVFLPIGLLDRNANQLFKWFSVHNTIFVRPDSNDKPFTGTTMSSRDWNSDMKLIRSYDVPIDEMCVVTYPMTCTNEMRFIIGNGKVITGSYYVWDRKPYKGEAFHETSLQFKVGERFAKECADRGYAPDDVWVLDIAEFKKGTIYNDWTHHILEVGSFSACGLYGADTDKLVDFFNNEYERKK